MTWRERIIEAEARGKFTNDDLGHALGFATCAVGEQVSRGVIADYRVDELPGGLDVRLAEIRSTETPKTLIGLGSWFCGAVVRNDFTKAHRLLDLIEDRALQLKRERLDAA